MCEGNEEGKRMTRKSNRDIIVVRVKEAKEILIDEFREEAGEPVITDWDSLLY